MASIEDNIFAAIKDKGRGSIFFPSDFTSYGEVKAVGKSLERLTAKVISFVWLEVYIYILRLIRSWGLAY